MDILRNSYVPYLACSAAMLIQANLSGEGLDITKIREQVEFSRPEEPVEGPYQAKPFEELEELTFPLNLSDSDPILPWHGTSPIIAFNRARFGVLKSLLAEIVASDASTVPLVVNLAWNGRFTESGTETDSNHRWNSLKAHSRTSPVDSEKNRTNEKTLSERPYLQTGSSELIEKTGFAGNIAKVTRDFFTPLLATLVSITALVLIVRKH